MKIKNIAVLSQTFGRDRFRNDRQLVLQMPAKDDLCRALLLRRGDLLQKRMKQRTHVFFFLVLAFQIGQRTITGDDDFLSRAELAHRPLVQIRMQFDLIDRRTNPADAQNFLQFRRVEIRHADRTNEFQLDEPFHRLPSVRQGRAFGVVTNAFVVALRPLIFRHLLQGDRPMHQIEIDVVQAEFRQTVSTGPFDVLGDVMLK